jgi:thiocyanate desulfurase
MTEVERRTATQETPKIDLMLPLPPEDNVPARDSRAEVDAFLARREAVTKSDHEEFQQYLREKQAQARAAHAEAKPSDLKSSKITRRGMIKVAAGTAIVGESAALGYNAIQSGALGSFSTASIQSLGPGGAVVAEAQREPIARELINYKSDIGGSGLGRWIAVLPTKMGGGAYAIDLHTNRVLSSVWYWNYGDFNPIAHHVCAFPSADPYSDFEFVNSTQGGKNSLIYGIPTNITEPAQGFNIYRVRYDGSQMQVLENVSETTGLGLGVHVTVNPKDAQSYFVTDGQKDIAACFDRTTSRVKAALKFDWRANSKDLARAWQDGGTLKITKIHSDPATGKYDYLGTKGQKIEWEMVPMGELFVEEGTLPGDDPFALSGADGTIWYPTGRWAATVVRLCGGIAILDAEHNFDPVTFVQFNKDSQDHYEVVKVGEDHWEITFEKIRSPGHEIGFSPDGRFLCMMNNLRENNCSVFSSSDPDPRKWRKIAHVEDPLWRGKYPNPFHMVFSLDSKKLYLSVLHPSPAASGIMVVDTDTWTIRKEIQGIGPDLQTPAITYDGKFVLCPFSGFQRLSSGIAVIETATDNLVGILPSSGGHHDCVIVPTELAHMKHTRSCTL